jgi:hypothetical protein
MKKQQKLVKGVCDVLSVRSVKHPNKCVNEKFGIKHVQFRGESLSCI